MVNWEKDGDKILLHAHEEFILKKKKKKRVITVAVPEGLLD